MAANTKIKYHTVRANFDHIVERIKPALEELARKAFAHYLITSRDLSLAENFMIPVDKESKASKLLQLILDKIKGKEDLFYTFVAILKEIPDLEELAGDLQTKLKGKYDFEFRTSYTSDAGNLQLPQESNAQHFRCNCGKNCSLEDYVGGLCPVGSMEKVFPNYSVSGLGLSQDDEDQLIRKLTRETNNVAKKFRELIYDTFESLDKREIPVKKVRAFALVAGKHGVINRYQENHDQELARKENVYDIQTFLVEHNYISFFNYQILECIIRRLGTNDDKKKLDEYLQAFHEFCKRSIFAIPQKVIADSVPALKTIFVVGVNENLWFSTNSQSPQAKFTMEDMYTLQENIADIIGLEPSHILICDIRKKCIQFSFTILSGVELFPLVPSELEQLSALGITVIKQPKNEPHAQQLKKETATSRQENEDCNGIRSQNIHLQDMNDALREKENIIQEKDHVLHDKQNEIQTLRQQLATSHNQLELTWRESKNAPCKMKRGHDAVVDGDMVYFNAGGTRNIYAYDSSNGTWKQLLDSETEACSLAVINNVLTTIGGRLMDGKITNQLFSLIKVGSELKWEEKMSPMPTSRSFSTTMCTNKVLIVAGGRDQRDKTLRTVEIMDITTEQWSTAADLPEPLQEASAVICGDHIYMLSGYSWLDGLISSNSVYTCSLAHLFLSRKQSKSSQESSSLNKSLSCQARSTVWKTIADVPVEQSVCVALNNQLLAVGGRSTLLSIDAIHVYHPITNSWDVLEISEMKTSRYECFAAVLPQNRILVVGGYKHRVGFPTNSVEIATAEYI